jgi:hypothetical protein
MPHRTKAIGSTLVLTIVAMSAMAQDKSAAFEKACGPEKTQFEVKRAKSQHPLRETEPGKARVYFIQDLGIATCVNCVTVRIGMDGTWVGANQRNSYFSVSVEPGEHHLCAIPQESHLQRLVGLAHFTAEAGKTYYFRERMIGEQEQAVFDFGPIDSDQAEYFIDTYPLSVSYPKNEK